MSERRHTLIDARDPRNREYKLITALLVFYRLWRLPIVALYTNTYLAMVLLVILTITLVFTVESFRVNKVVVFSTLLLAVMSLFERNVEGFTFLNNIWSCFLDLFPVVVGCLLVVNKMDKVIKVMIPLILICNFVSAITTYIGLATFPDASRILATTNDEYLTFYKYNIGGFGFIYSLVITHPLVIGLLRTRNKRTISIVYSAVTALCVFRSKYAMAAMLFIASCSAYALPVKGDMEKAKKWVRVIAVGLIVLLLFAPAMLDAMAEWELLEGSADKIRDVARILRGGQGINEDTFARQNSYSKSLQAFMNNPLGGTIFSGEVYIGYHSFAFDTMAYWGIWGIIVQVMFYASFERMYRRFTGMSPIYYCALLTFILSIALSILNPKMWPYELGFVTPMVIRYCSLRFDDTHEHREGR